ncbi:MAG: hypothetical protein L6R45_25505 [Anaerolineae bacterium]|nr:hypothetical protein [Anaerolineae bacterium]
MVNDTLTQARRLIDRLTPLEQARLLAYLTSRIAALIESAPPITQSPGSAAAWQEFFCLGDAVAASDTPETPTLTATVISMRR